MADHLLNSPGGHQGAATGLPLGEPPYAAGARSIVQLVLAAGARSIVQLVLVVLLPCALQLVLVVLLPRALQLVL